MVKKKGKCEKRKKSKQIFKEIKRRKSFEIVHCSGGSKARMKYEYHHSKNFKHYQCMNIN